MKLPLLNPVTKINTVSGGFNGIGENELLDAVNLVCSGYCHTRSPRKAVSVFNVVPDQVITCGKRLFFRYHNLLREYEKNIYGELYENGNVYNLKELDPKTNRKLISCNDKLFVFPDKIQIGESSWLHFAEKDSVAVALPFKNSRTLCYPKNPESENFCSDATLLKVGMQLNFSWVPDKTYTIQTIESYISDSETEPDYNSEGIRITLDDDVPLYNVVPVSAVTNYCDPQTGPILRELTFGYSHKIKFSKDKLIVTNTSAPYEIVFGDFFKIGQTVKISGSSAPRNYTTAKIVNIENGCLQFDYNFTAIQEPQGTLLTITPVIPDFSHLLITEDRLFGVDNNESRFYISALGEPFLFYDSDGSVEAPWSIALNQTVTGLGLWMDNVICFTETGGFRIMGYNANNFRIRHLSVSGIKKGCDNSLCRIGNTLYYCSDKGVMRYSGSSDTENFNPTLKITNVKSAIADGMFAYMLFNDKIWVCSADGKVRWSENGENVSHFFVFDGDRYLIINNAIYIAESTDENPVDWSFALNTIPNDQTKKVQPLSFILNHSQNTDCTFTLFCKPYGEEKWEKCGFYHIKGEGQIKIPLSKFYCNGFNVKAEGSGMFEPENWSVTYRKTG